MQATLLAFLGRDEDGNYAFMSADVDEKEPSTKYVKLVYAYAPETLRTAAETAEASLPIVEETLQLRALRERSYGKSLEIHRKGQNPQQSKAKPQTPPPASPE